MAWVTCDHCWAHEIEVIGARGCWRELVAESVARARTYFTSGYEILRYIPRRPAACVQTMAGIYEELLKKIERDPGLPLKARAALSKTEKLRVVVRSWLSSA